MAWIESHQTIWHHPKTQRAARLAGANLHEMIGLLHCLWWWSVDYAETGDLSKYDPLDVEAAIGWQSSPGKLWNALSEAGFIDADKRLHDWDMYVGRLLEKRTEARERAQMARERARTVRAPNEDAARTVHAPNEDAARTVHAPNEDAARTVHPITNQPPPTKTNQPKPTNQNQPNPPPSPNARANGRAKAEKPVVVVDVAQGLLADLWHLLLDNMGVVIKEKREDLMHHDIAVVAAWNCWLQAHNASNGKHPLGAGVAINRIRDNTPLPGDEWATKAKEWLAWHLEELGGNDQHAVAAIWNELFPNDRFLVEES